MYTNENQDKVKNREKTVTNKLLYKRLLNIEAKPGAYSKQTLDKSYVLVRRDKFIKSRNALKLKQLKEDNNKIYSKIDKVQSYTKIQDLNNDYKYNKRLSTNISHNARRIDPDYSAKSIYFYHVAHLDEFKDTIAITQNEYANKLIQEKSKTCGDIEVVPEDDDEKSSIYNEDFTEED